MLKEITKVTLRVSSAQQARAGWAGRSPGSGGQNHGDTRQPDPRHPSLVISTPAAHPASGRRTLLPGGFSVWDFGGVWYVAGRGRRAWGCSRIRLLALGQPSCSQLCEVRRSQAATPEHFGVADGRNGCSGSSPVPRPLL